MQTVPLVPDASSASASQAIQVYDSDGVRISFVCAKDPNDHFRCMTVVDSNEIGVSRAETLSLYRCHSILLAFDFSAVQLSPRPTPTLAARMWPLCSYGSSIYLSHTTAALYRTSWCKQRSRRRRKSAFTSNSVFTNRTQTLFCVKLCLSSLSTLHCRSLFLLLRELLCPQVEATSLLRRISPLHIYFLCLRQGAAPA